MRYYPNVGLTVMIIHIHISSEIECVKKRVLSRPMSENMIDNMNENMENNKDQ
jgi:hypothetical protein